MLDLSPRQRIIVAVCLSLPRAGPRQRLFAECPSIYRRQILVPSAKMLCPVVQTVADMMKGKTPEEIREIFNIKNDFTKEEDEIRRENQWAF